MDIIKHHTPIWNVLRAIEDINHHHRSSQNEDQGERNNPILLKRAYFIK